MTREAATKYDENMRRQAREAFQNHRIVRSSEGRWLLMRTHPDGNSDNVYWTEVISLACGGLYVGGDIDHVISITTLVHASTSKARVVSTKVRYAGLATTTTSPTT